ncbi:hypothetical protein KR009_001825 [Drosophila setifemur]|nr:hypothetical protein KR009_001825 [Drosophila setifemur]
MAIDEPQIVPFRVDPKPEVGYLKQETTWIHCPSCLKSGMSVVQLETVSCLQRFLGFTKLWFVNSVNCITNFNQTTLACSKKWSGRKDINHYCLHCGCFIGRFVPINCSERCISKSARRQAAVDEMTLKKKPTDCAERAQKGREAVLAIREKNRKDAEEEQDKPETQIAVHQ